MGTGLLIVLLLAVLVSAYSFQLHRAQRIAAQHLQRALMSERVFAESFHASPIPHALVNLSTHEITEVNGAYVRLLGFERDELINQSQAGLGIEDEAEAVVRARRLRRNGVLRDYTTT